MRVVVGNAFSVNMVQNDSIVIKFRKISLEEAKKIVKDSYVYSIVGHEATAKVLTQLLGVPIMTNRINYSIQPDDILIIFTIPFRLEEGKVLSEEEVERIKSNLNIYLVQPM